MKTRHTSTHKICLVLIQSNLLEKLLKEYSKSLFTRNWPDPGLTYSEWDPHLQKDKVMLENVQKFGLRICARQWDLGYNELLSNFHAPTLQDRRLYHKLCNIYKIVNNLISFPPSIFVPRHSSHHANTYVQPFAHSNAFLNSYVPSTVSSWNSLSSNITNQPTLSTFKSHLSTYLL